MMDTMEPTGKEPQKNPTPDTGERLHVPDKVPERVLEDPHSLRTYQSDMADAIKTGQATVVKIALAEEKKREAIRKNASPVAGKNIMYSVSGFIFILLALAIAYYIFYLKKPPTVPAIEDNTPSSIVYANEATAIDVTGVTPLVIAERIRTEIEGTPPAINNIRNIYFTEVTGEQTTRVSSTRFLTLLESHAPAELLRTLEPEFMVGAFTYDGTKTFVLLSTNTYETALPALLTWETNLFDDWYGLFGIDISGDNQVLFQSTFEDAIIKNRDTRALKDSTGKIVLFYSFLDESTIIIAEDAVTFSEVIDRLTRSTIKR